MTEACLYELEILTAGITNACRWAMMLPPSILVCPVEIPGRGRREGEPALSEVTALAEVLAHALPLQVPPYADFS